MAGKPQWTAKSISISSSITSGKGFAYGVGVLAKGTTINSIRLRDGVAGTCRFEWNLTKRGVANRYNVTAHSMFVTFPTPIAFGSKIICSIGSAACENKSTVATVLYRDLV